MAAIARKPLPGSETGHSHLIFIKTVCSVSMHCDHQHMSKDTTFGVYLHVKRTVSAFNVHAYSDQTNNLSHKLCTYKLLLFFNPNDLGQLHATPNQLSQLHLTVHPNQTACSVPTHWRKKKKKHNWRLSTLLNHIPHSSFTALLPVNSANTKAANCCLHNLQPFNSTNPHIGSHEGRGA